MADAAGIAEAERAIREVGQVVPSVVVAMIMAQ